MASCTDWVVDLGPESYGPDDLYEYSIVTDPTTLALFVLTRNITTFEDVYEADVLDWLENNGFNNTWNQPIETYHDETCLYPDTDGVYFA